MINPSKIEQLAKQVADNLPPGVRQFSDEIDKQVKQVLQSGLSKLDMVPREEFDVQTQVLLRTRQKLQALEARVEALESHLLAPNTPEPEAPAAQQSSDPEGSEQAGSDKTDS